MKFMKFFVYMVQRINENQSPMYIGAKASMKFELNENQMTDA